MVDLAEHQLKAIDSLDSGKILCGGVGSGKTRTAIAYYLKHEVRAEFPVNGRGHFRPPQNPMELYVITTAKKRDSLDWEEEALPFRIVREGHPSMYGLTIKVDSWNNIGKYTDVKQAFFIFDEQRIIGAGAWVKSFLNIARYNRWILLSATPGDVWLDYAPVFIANGFYRNRTDFKDQHVIYRANLNFPQVDRYIGTKKLVRQRDQLLVLMPVQRHTNRHISVIHTDYDRDEWKWLMKHRFNREENRPFKTAQELFWNLRKLVNSHWSKTSQLKSLLKEHPKLVVFYNFDYELDILRAFCIEQAIEWGELNGHQSDEIPEGDSWLYLVQYSAGSEAWNCVATNAMVFFSLNYSYRVIEQSMGRIDRLNTPHENLHYYILQTNSPIDLGISKAVREKRIFNETAFVRKLTA